MRKVSKTSDRRTQVNNLHKINKQGNTTSAWHTTDIVKGPLHMSPVEIVQGLRYAHIDSIF